MSMAGCTLCMCTALFIWMLTCKSVLRKGVEAATLSPRSISVCQGEEVVIKCTETETDDRYLRWTIRFEGIQVHTIQLILSKQFNETDMEPHGLGLFFHSEWTSFSPLCSMFTINTTTADLNGATVECAPRSNMQTDSLLISIQDEVPNILDLWPEATDNTDLEADNVIVTVEWESDGVGPVDYYVTATPLNGSGLKSTITTNQTSHLLTVPYNSTYNISVVGSNCAGNSSELVKTFTFTAPRCPSPHVNLSEDVTIAGEDLIDNSFVKNFQLNLMCISEDRILNSSDSVIKCTCTSDGNCSWFPEISMIQCMSASPKVNGLGLGDVYVIILSAVIPPLAAFIILGTVIAVSIAVRRKQGNRRSQQVLDEILQEESYARLHAVNPSVNPRSIGRELMPTGNYSLLSPDRNIYDAVYDILEQPKAVDNSAKIPLSDNVSYSGTVDDQDQETQKNSLLVNLDSLLSKLQSVQKTSKWQQLATATEMPQEIADELTGCSDEESRIKIVEKWLKTQERDLNWKEVAKEMREVGLELLAEEIETWTTDHQSCTQLNARENDDTDNEVTARAPTPASVLQD